MNQTFIESFKELDSQLEVQQTQWQLISESLFGKQPKSDCCHAEVTTYLLKDVCSCCLEQFELEK
jgi:hypothetical protein